MAMRGRPKKPAKERRSSIFRICLTDAEHKAIEAMAQEKGLDASTWARSELLQIVKAPKHGKTT